MSETTDRIKVEPWCAECGSLQVGSHGIFCDRQTLEEWKESARQYHAAWLKNEKRDREWMNRQMARVKRFQDHATFWQGKYAIVVRENNALRRKLSKQEKTDE